MLAGLVHIVFEMKVDAGITDMACLDCGGVISMRLVDAG